MKKKHVKKARPNRYLAIDTVRGFAVLLMVIFHIAFDLNSYGFISIDLFRNPFWFGFPRFIVTLFMLCVGVSLALVHKRGIKWKGVRRRFYTIGAWSLVISTLTFLLFRQNFVFFGILHCIAVSSVAGVFFVSRPKLSLLLGLIIVVSNMVFQPTLIPLSDWLNVRPMDYIPFYPWFGVVLLGIYLESVNLHQISIRRSSLTRPFEVMGKHALKIYLLHRPIVFGIVSAIFYLKR